MTVRREPSPRRAPAAKLWVQVVNDFLDNPRRFPRVPARLRVGVSARGDGFQAVTEDLGPGGCLLVSPRPLTAGLALRLAIDADGANHELLSVAGRVAWVRAEERLRAGVAFDARQPGAVRPDDWFRRFLAAEPGLASRMVRAPERLHLDAPLYLLPPPRHIVDFSSEEAELLRRIENGATLRQLFGAQPEGRATLGRPLFSLFEKRALTLAMGQSAPSWQWREVLGRLEEEGVLEARPAEALGGRPPETSRPPARTAPPPVLRRSISTPVPGSIPAVHVAPMERLAPAPVVAPRDPVGPAAVPFPSRLVRPPAAQEAFDKARELVAGGDVHGAIGLLRRAIQLSPRDAEIASLLGSLAFRGRQIE